MLSEFHTSRPLVVTPAMATALRDGAATQEDFESQLLEYAKSLAHPPLSTYEVGAVLLGASGNYYFGANLEFARSDVVDSVHAEQAAVHNAILHGESNWQRLIVSAAPCGHCRQFLREFMDDPADLQVVIGAERLSLAELLPHSFGPRDLGVEDAVSKLRGANSLFDIDWGDSLEQPALASAQQGYTPYSNQAVGIALQTTDQRLFIGTRLECVAHNPTLPAARSVLSQLHLAGFRIEDVAAAEIALVGTGASAARLENRAQEFWTRELPFVPLQRTGAGQA